MGYQKKPKMNLKAFFGHSGKTKTRWNWAMEFNEVTKKFEPVRTPHVQGVSKLPAAQQKATSEDCEAFFNSLHRDRTIAKSGSPRAHYADIREALRTKNKEKEIRNYGTSL